MNRYFLKLLAVLFVVKGLMALLIQFGGIHLMPDEAQYWTWSESLSYGYYSKPPGIAWQIRAGTALFGNTEFGVRFGALVISILLPMAIYGLSRAAGLLPRFCFWAATLFTLAPIGFASSIFATTDNGFLLFWTIAAAIFAKSLLEGKAPQFIWIGVAIGLGSLFKWPVYLLWVPILGMSLYLKRFSKQALVAVGISLLGLLPSLLWNIQHDFATVRHVTTSVTPAGWTGNPGAFLAAQIALFSPVIFVLLVMALSSIGGELKKMPHSIAFLWWTTVGCLGAIFALSCMKKVQGNWAVCAYPTAFPLLMSYCAMQSEKIFKWLRIGIIASLLMIASFPFLPYSLNPCKEGIGWNRLAKGIKNAGYDPKEHFLFSDRYQMTSLLSFYPEEKKRAYFLNLQGHRKNQFSYWPSLKDEQLGKTGFFVEVIKGNNAMKKAFEVYDTFKTQLKPYFGNVSEMVTMIPLATDGTQVVKVALVVRCENYNGQEPQQTKKY